MGRTEEALPARLCQRCYEHTCRLCYRAHWTTEVLSQSIIPLKPADLARSTSTGRFLILAWCEECPHLRSSNHQCSVGFPSIQGIQLVLFETTIIPIIPHPHIQAAFEMTRLDLLALPDDALRLILHRLNPADLRNLSLSHRTAASGIRWLITELAKDTDKLYDRVQRETQSIRDELRAHAKKLRSARREILGDLGKQPDRHPCVHTLAFWSMHAPCTASACRLLVNMAGQGDWLACRHLLKSSEFCHVTAEVRTPMHACLIMPSHALIGPCYFPLGQSVIVLPPFIDPAWYCFVLRHCPLLRQTVISLSWSV